MLFISSKNISCSADERPFFFDLDQRCLACNLWKSQMYTKIFGNCCSRAAISASLDYGKCFTYRGLIFGLAHEFSRNLTSYVGIYTNEKKWNCVPCRFVRGVHQCQFTTISLKNSLLPWLLMYKEEGFLSSSRSWFIFFVNDIVSGLVKEVAFGRLSLPVFYFFT